MSSAVKVARLQNGEDADRGREARKAVPRSGHGEWAPAAGEARSSRHAAPADRDPTARAGADPLRTDARLAVHVLPRRCGGDGRRPGRDDLHRASSSRSAATLTSPTSAGFAAPDRRLMFGPNDFDETLPGPWEWDVKRMAASIEIAGRDIDLPAGRRRQIVERAVRQYREAMLEFSRESLLDAWYERLDADELTARFGTRLDADGQELFDRTFDKARRKTSARAVRKLTEMVDGQASVHQRAAAADADPRAVRNRSARAGAACPRAVRPVPRRACTPTAGIWCGRTPSPTWPARWSASAASAPGRGWCCWSPATVGTRSSCRPRRRRRRCSSRSSGRSEYDTHGERVVRGQRMMQAATDIFLSWQRSPSLDGVERDYYVRQLWDWKASADLSRMTEHGLLTYTRACAWSLARSHARSGDRLAIAAYLGKGPVFDRAVAHFSELYADQNERDYERLRAGRRRRRGGGARRRLDPEARPSAKPGIPGSPPRGRDPADRGDASAPGTAPAAKASNTSAAGAGVDHHHAASVRRHRWRRMAAAGTSLTIDSQHRAASSGSPSYVQMEACITPRAQ